MPSLSSFYYYFFFVLFNSVCIVASSFVFFPIYFQTFILITTFFFLSLSFVLFQHNQIDLANAHKDLNESPLVSDKTMKKRTESFSKLSTFDPSPSTPITHFYVQQYKKVVVPELTSPVTALDIEETFDRAQDVPDRSAYCPDGNVLRRVASITAESFGIKPTNFCTPFDSSSERKEKIVSKDLLTHSKFDLKSFEKFEGYLSIQYV